ncbi:chemotaxis protein CheW [Bacillus gobiensis]|uniref:chemotaxis protein CheW n=1 Tax=Bacillus gobiensis TaxID=1441095 RepID=UPI003D2327CD
MGTFKAILFHIHNELFLVDISKIQSIELPGTITPIGGFPEEILGVSQIREELVPVIDLGTVVAHRPIVQDEESKLLLLSSAYGTLGCLVSCADDIIEMEASDVKTMSIRSTTADYFGGAVERDGKLVVKLLPEHLYQGIEGIETISSALHAQ